jgi:ATP-binding cassette subfamily B protein
VIRHQLQPTAPPARWPFGWTPAGWSALGQVALVSGIVLAMAASRATINYLYSIAVGRLVQTDIVPRMRSEVYDKLQRMSFRFFDATRRGRSSTG